MESEVKVSAWLCSLEHGSDVAIDEGGTALVALKDGKLTGARYEVGGVPELEHWGEYPNHPVSDWSYEVANGDTRLGYIAWVKHLEQMAVYDVALCRTCGDQYGFALDSYDGECPSCADKTAEGNEHE